MVLVLEHNLKTIVELLGLQYFTIPLKLDFNIQIFTFMVISVQ